MLLAFLAIALFALPDRIKKLGYKIKTILLFLANIFVTGF